MNETNTTILNGVVNTHNKFKGSFFWTSGINACHRRRNEEQFPSTDLKIEMSNGDVVEIEQTYSESAKNCYYSCGIYLNQIKKDIRLVKRLIKDPSKIFRILSYGVVVFHSRKSKVAKLLKDVSQAA